MAKLTQFYDGDTVPLRIDGDTEDPARAWRSQRARVRSWLNSVPDSEWHGPTRCDLWDMTALVRHMASTSQYLGYTLHQAAGRKPTTMLRNFDTHETIKVGMAMLGDMTPSEARDVLSSMDAAVDVELDRVHDAGWSVIAEAPLGHLSADLAVSHFFFDSWVHEYDLMLPRAETPVVDAREVEVITRYLTGMAVVVTGAETPIVFRLSHPDLTIGVDAIDGIVEVALGTSPAGAAVIEGRAVDVVDRMTGRGAGSVTGDERALGVLDGFGRLFTTDSGGGSVVNRRSLRR